jgi:hypothetical protein
MAGLYAPLPTLRSRPRGRLRTARGRRGLLFLHRRGLSPHTPCRSPGALTRVAACTLALSPIRDTLSEGFSHFVTSIAAPAGWSGCQVGLAPTGKRRLITAHTQNGRARNRRVSQPMSSWPSDAQHRAVPGPTEPMLRRSRIGADAPSVMTTLVSMRIRNPVWSLGAWGLVWNR